MANVYRVELAYKTPSGKTSFLSLYRSGTSESDAVDNCRAELLRRANDGNRRMASWLGISAKFVSEQIKTA